MRGKLSWPVFWALLGVFVVIACLFSIPPLRDLLAGSAAFLTPLAVFSLLGIALIVLTLREKVRGKLKKFFLLTGASATAFFASILLHAAVDALFVYFFGESFWDRVGGDEPVFFTIVIFLCPLGFLVGAIGSIIFRVDDSGTAKKIAPGP